MTQPNILVISTSLAQQSRSRTAADFMIETLTRKGSEVSKIYLKDAPLAGYPLSIDDPNIKKYIALLEQADAVVLCYPIHNWGASGQTREFLSYVLDKRTMRNKIFLLIAGCSTPASYTVFSSTVQTLMGEVQAIVLGASILACGDDVNKETGEIAEKLQLRLQNGADLVYRFAQK